MRRPPILRIEAVTRTQRNEMIARIAEAIHSGGGCILESRFFSNLALFIEAEIAAARVDQLVAALARTELQLDSRSLAKVHDFAAHWQTEHKPTDLHTIHLLVTFIHTDPDLRIPVPAIPG